MTSTTTRRKASSLSETIVGFLETAIFVCAIFYLLAALNDLGLRFWILLVLPVVVFVSVLIHELGHALGAMVAGWQVIVVTVWPFAVHFPARRLVLDGRVNIQDGGGFVAGVPGSLASATRLRKAAFIVGGPVASLIATIACFVAASVLQNANPLASGPIHIVTRDDRGTLVLAAISFGLFNFRALFATIIPRTYSHDRPSDGKMLLEAIWGDDPAKASWSTWIATMLHYNVRLRAIPGWMYEAASAGAEKFGEDQRLHDGWDISRALDAEHVDAARTRRLIEEHRERYPDAQEGADWLAACDAILASFYERDGARAAAVLADRPNTWKDAPLIPAAEAAVAARNGDKVTVTRKVHEMQTLLDGDSPFPNLTFADIRKQIESIATSVTDKAQSPAEIG